MDDTTLTAVIGSCNFDLAVRTDALPAPSETRMGDEYLHMPGGKGLNQATGLARLGAETAFCGCVGDDPFGREIIDRLKQTGLDVSHISVNKTAPTGTALITLAKDGLRTIVVSPGANNHLSPSDAERFLAALPCFSMLITQLEIPLDTAVYALSAAKRRGALTVLNASPVKPLPDDAFRLIDVLILSRTELGALTGKNAEHLLTAQEAAKSLVEKGTGTVLVTMGRRGVLAVRKPGALPLAKDDETARFIQGFPVEATTGTAAASAFVAGFAHSIRATSKPELFSAIKYGLAAMAASLSGDPTHPQMPDSSETQAVLAAASLKKNRPSQNTSRDTMLAEKAKSIRRRIIRMLSASGSGHPGGSLSVVEILTALYFHTMVFNPKDPKWPDRDRLVLSKGHAAPALYGTLMEAGFLDPALETELRKLDSPLQGHPDLKRCPGVDMSTGSLGQGLSAAVGMALAAIQTGRSSRVFCILGDGEIEEGQIWEAAMSAAHRKLGNLVAVVDYNALQIDGNLAKIKSSTKPIGDKWKAFGWRVIHVDGHSTKELIAAFDRADGVRDMPVVLIANTVKGRGVSFMEGVLGYHGSTLTQDETRRALAELQEEAS